MEFYDISTQILWYLLKFVLTFYLRQSKNALLRTLHSSRITNKTIPKEIASIFGVNLKIIFRLKQWNLSLLSLVLFSRE